MRVALLLSAGALLHAPFLSDHIPEERHLQNQSKFESTRLSGSLIFVAALLAPLVASAQTLPNHPPSISGVAPATTIAGQLYSFQPSASDADGNTLVFSVTDKPVWASLNKATGRLSGTPTSAQAGVYGAIEISVSDGYTRTKLPKFSITVAANALANHPPSISGTPVPTVAAGSGYSFVPSATDADGNPLVFSVTSKPSWADLNKATGRLTGVPTNAQAGSYEEIEISVSDGYSRVSLPKFTITVTPTAPTTRTVTLSWTPPLVNTDGTTLTDLSGYRILYGSVSHQYGHSIDVNNAGLTRYVLENLPAGTYYFAMTARNTAGSESDASVEVRADLT